jgi:hypothetical protein
MERFESAWNYFDFLDACLIVVRPEGTPKYRASRSTGEAPAANRLSRSGRLDGPERVCHDKAGIDPQWAQTLQAPSFRPLRQYHSLPSCLTLGQSLAPTKTPTLARSTLRRIRTDLAGGMCHWAVSAIERAASDSGGARWKLEQSCPPRRSEGLRMGRGSGIGLRDHVTEDLTPLVLF